MTYADSSRVLQGIIQAGCIAVTVAESFSDKEVAIRMQIAKAKAVIVQVSSILRK
jgi:acyl-coenzyme A synthetase/AMP-(fatty) acid ligase